MDAVAEIKRLYYATTKSTIQKDLDKAIDLVKTLNTEEEREKVSVFMDGLSQMRSEWGVNPSSAPARKGTAKPAAKQGAKPGAKPAATKR